MVGIVEADGHDLADLRHGRPEAGRASDLRQLRGIERSEMGQRPRLQRCAVDIADLGGEIAQHAFAVEKAGFLGTGRTIAQEFH